MSTDHQRYSLENQQAAIAEYATRHGYEVVRTYADPGKSGLTLQGRTALQSLLADVMAADRPFSAILVLDVSRWGRFQDPDEAAHYEFICRQAGVRVVYCAEMFSDADSFEGKILKHLKRVMAGEYSRELSSKLYRAHIQQAALGYKQGGRAPYGFRRLIVDRDGQPRMLLEPGQQKALSTDRVVLVPGPPNEQETIRRIFRWYVYGRLTATKIAARLASEGLRSDTGGPWYEQTIWSILKNEAYIGLYVYNRTTARLRQPRRRNPEEMWVRARVLRPIVSETLFRKARAKSSPKERGKFPDAFMLQELRRILRRHGYLSECLIRESFRCPKPATYIQRFGSLMRAYELVGYTSPAYRGCTLRGAPWEDNELLDGLRRIWDENGYVTGALINADPALPSTTFIARRFGSLMLAYGRAGFPLARRDIQAASSARRIAREGGASRPTYPRADGCGTTVKIPDEIIVRGLKDLLRRRGYLTRTLIDEEPGLPAAHTICKHFGSMQRAYTLAGWERSQQQILRERHKRRCQRLNAWLRGNS